VENDEHPKVGHSTLADHLFGRAFFKDAQTHLGRFQEEYDRGAIEQAREHLRRAGISGAKALVSLTSPRLSEAENQEWLSLQRAKYFVDEQGFISEATLDEESENRLEEITRKAFRKQGSK
jgi:hypothetical protein